ncbi:MAG: hypothetical protein AB7K24_34685 [Gemmataceae bacterium]
MTSPRLLVAAVCLACLFPAFTSADDQKSPGEGAEPYAELSKMIHTKIVEKAPKKFEDTKDWGGTIPVGPVRLPRLRRTVVRVNGEDRFPDGAWKRSLIWLDDPAKDIQVRVVEIKPVENGLYRVKIASQVSMHGERERQQWRNGLKLIGLTVQADAVIGAEFDIDVKVGFEGGTLIPDLVVEPKVAASRLELRKFDLNRVGPVGGELTRDLGNELKDFLETLLKTYETDVKNATNEALGRALKDGKVKIPATEVLKLKAGLKPKS